jgi:aldose 1-epimerase
VAGLDVLELRLGEATCRVAPALGGALLALNIGGVDVLRRSSAAPVSVLDTACFPLVPFANRIAEGRFRYAGTQIDLPADEATPSHAHHGHGWRRPWAVASQEGSAAKLTYHHPADRWPWSYQVTQHLTLLSDGLAIELEVTNLADQPMPCGFGLHPYFALETESYIEVAAPQRLLPDQRGIPCIPAPGLSGRHSLSDLPASDDLLLDTSGRIRIGAAAWEIELTALKAIGWQFYLPPSSHFFCLEPVSHRPDSFNQGQELDTIAAKASQCWRFTLARLR